jgi:beta-barrel assembly-enhancing protease
LYEDNTVKAQINISPSLVEIFCLVVIFTMSISNCTLVTAGNTVDERKNAKIAARRIEAEWPIRSINDPVTRYIQSLGQKLGEIADGGRTIRWTFTVLRDRAPYAFTIGAGHIYLAEGVLAFVRNEEELAAILAHEIGHQLSGHLSTPTESGSRRPLGLTSNRPAASYQQKVGSLTQVYDLGKEEDADRRAIHILQRAGFDPHALVKVLKKLPSGGAYHYYNDERRTLALQEELTGVPSHSRENSKDFQTIQKLVRNEQ